MQNPVVWFEVVGKDGDRLRRFYSELFGWQAQMASGDKSYGLVTPTNGGIGGGLGQSQDGGEGHVTFFVEVDDPSAYLARREARRHYGRPTDGGPELQPDLRLLHRPAGPPDRVVEGPRPLVRACAPAIRPGAPRLVGASP